MKRMFAIMAILFVGGCFGYLAALYIRDAEAKTVRALNTTKVVKKSIPMRKLAGSAPVKVREIVPSYPPKRAPERPMKPVQIVAPTAQTKTVTTTDGQAIDEFTQSPGKNIDVSLEVQHFWAYSDGKLVYDGPVSASYGPTIPVDAPSIAHKTAHNHLGVFWIFDKKPRYRSKSYNVVRYNWQFFFQGHAFHACAHSDIGKLGTKASAGCIRLHPDTAEKLFTWTDIGTVVRVRE